MARKSLIMATGILVVVMAGKAIADMPTIDMTAVKQLTDQLKSLNQMVQQNLQVLDSLNFIKQFENTIQSAMGAASIISLPITNLQSMESQLQNNLACLIPSTSMPGFKDINFGSVCNVTGAYRDALFMDKILPAIQNGSSKLTVAQGQTKIAQQRQALLADTAVRGLALADTMQNKEVQNLTNSAADLQSSLNAAQTVQDRLQVLDQIGLLQVRATADQNQMMALLLKLESAKAVAESRTDMTVPSIPPTGGSSSTSGTGS